MFRLTLSPENRTGKVQDYIYEDRLITAANTQELSTEHFMKAVTPPHSRTWSNIVFSGDRKTANFKSMQVIALDFDNTDHERIIRPAMVVERCKEEGFDVSFIYSTFSHTHDSPRFRTVWILDTAIDNPDDAKNYINILYQMFPESDNAKDLARIWLGGKGILYQSDYILPVEKIVELEAMQILTNSSPKNRSRNLMRYWKKNQKRLYYNRRESGNSSYGVPLYGIDKERVRLGICQEPMCNAG